MLIEIFFFLLFVLSYFFLICHDAVWLQSVGQLADKQELEEIFNYTNLVHGVTEPVFLYRTKIKKRNFRISVVSACTQLIQIHSDTAVQAVQFNGGVITWSNFVSCLTRIILMITGDKCQWNGSGYTSNSNVKFMIIWVTKIIAPILRIITFYCWIFHKIWNPPHLPNTIFNIKPHADWHMWKNGSQSCSK